MNDLFRWHENLPVQGVWDDVVFVLDMRERFCHCEKPDDLDEIEEVKVEIHGNRYRLIGKSCCVRNEIIHMRSEEKEQTSRRTVFSE